MRMRRVAGAAALTALLMAGPAAAFDPAKYAGTWTGTWKNNTFKVSGPMQAVATLSADGQSLVVDWNITGLFNCGPQLGTRTLVSGVDFTATGLNFATQNAAWGAGTITSTTKKKVDKIKANGTAPCNPSVSTWTVRGALKEAKMTGNMKIVFAQGTPKKARTTFAVTKQ